MAAATSSRNLIQADICSRGPPAGRFSASCFRKLLKSAVNLFLRRTPRGAPAFNNASRSACLGFARLSSWSGLGRSSASVPRGRPATLRIAASSANSQASIIRTGTMPTQRPLYPAADTPRAISSFLAAYPALSASRWTNNKSVLPQYSRPIRRSREIVFALLDGLLGREITGQY